MHITLGRRSVKRITMVAAAGIVALGFIAAYTIQQQHITKAAPVPESCFTIDPGTGTITDYNPASDVACVSDVTIPSTVSGTTVSAVAGGAFADDTITSVIFPSTITFVESGAFNQTDITLTSITLNAAGNLTIGDGAFGAFSGTSIAITAGGDLDYRSDNFDGADLTSFSLDAGGDLILQNTSFSTAISADTATFHADGNVTASGGFHNATVGSATMTAGGDITIDGGGFLDNSVVGTLSIDADGALELAAGLYQSSNPIAIDEITLTAGTTLAVLSGSLSNVTGLTEATLTAGSGLLSIEDGSFSNNSSLTTLTLNGPAGVRIDDGSLATVPALTTLDFVAHTGDIYIYGFGGSGLTNLTIDTSGSFETTFGAFSGNNALTDISVNAADGITIANGTFSGLTSLSTVTLTSDNDITLSGGVLTYLPQLSELTVEGDNVLITNGSIAQTPILTTATLAASGTLTVNNGSVMGSTIENLTMSSGGSFSIGAGSFQYVELGDITFPSTLASIGAGAFSNSKIDSVTLTSTPTIGADAFSFNGVSFDPNTSTYSDLDQVSFVPIYVSLPNSYTDTVYPATDLDSDGVDDIAGGYLINPAQVTVQYEDEDGTQLASDTFSLGELGDGTPLTSYLVSANPTQDTSLYFHAGDQLTLSAPVIATYDTPADLSATLAAGSNTLTFVYEQSGTPDEQPDTTDDTPAAPNTGLPSSPYALALIGGAIVAGIAIITAAVFGIRRFSGR